MSQLNVTASRPTTPKACGQPNCLLNRTGVDAEYLVEIIVHDLAGRLLKRPDPESRRVVTCPQCAPGALHVIQSGRVHQTKARLEHLIELGQWHHRRYRRKKLRAW